MKKKKTKTKSALFDTVFDGCTEFERDVSFRICMQKATESRGTLCIRLLFRRKRQKKLHNEAAF